MLIQQLALIEVPDFAPRSIRNKKTSKSNSMSASAQLSFDFNKRNYNLIPYERLVKKATQKQLSEAKRLLTEYGAKDPDIAHRYLHISLSGKLIDDFVPINDNDFDANELEKQLPSNWKKRIKNEIRGNVSVSINNLFNFFFPDWQNNEDIDEQDKIKTLIIIEGALIELGWLPTKNPRIYQTPSMQAHKIHQLLKTNATEITLDDALAKLNLDKNIATIKKVTDIFLSNGWVKKRTSRQRQKQIIFRKK